LTEAPHARQLVRSPLLGAAKDGTVRDLALVARSEQYDAGQILWLEGDECHALRLVDKGLVRLRHLSKDGRQQIVSYVGPGRAANLVAVLDEGHALASADALVDTCILMVPKASFLDAVRRDVGLCASVAHTLASEMRRLDGMLRDMALYDVRARLARFLLTHAETHPAHERWTQETIAANIGTVRDVVGRILRDLRAQDIVRREQGRLVIVDRIALERMMEGS